MGDANVERRWYLMLFPDVSESQLLVSRLLPIAERAGGVAMMTPHVTIGYFTGSAAPDTVVRALSGLDGPQIRVRASGLFNWSERAHPQFGYTLSLRVERDEPLQRWQRAARAVLAASLRPTFAWEAQEPHMHIIGQLAAPPASTIARLHEDRDLSLTFLATCLLVSQQIGEDYITRLERTLAAS